MCRKGPPGCLDTMARLLRLVSRLIREDLPTLERPMTANSGYFGGGHWLTSTLLFTNSAVLTWEWLGGGSSSCISGNSGSCQLLLLLSAVCSTAAALLRMVRLRQCCCCW